MKMTEAVKAINKAYKALVEIYSAEDLKRERLTLAELDAARAIFNDVNRPGTHAHTFVKAAADLFKRSGYTVTETATGYKITC